MSESLDLQDKILVAANDRLEMREMFSHMQPGDKINGSFKASLDENGDKCITLSIDEIEFEKPEEENGVTSSDEPEEEPEEDSAAVRVSKNEDGVVDTPGNEPMETGPAM